MKRSTALPPIQRQLACCKYTRVHLSCVSARSSMALRIQSYTQLPSIVLTVTRYLSGAFANGWDSESTKLLRNEISKSLQNHVLFRLERWCSEQSDPASLHPSRY